MQPRVSISLVSASRSRFARIFSGNTGIDPYTTAVSDVYQDLFCEGNFTGKGLYDVDAFQAALHDRVGENKLLSHDLFESLFARAALATDIELLDDYPASYDAYAKRQHRWTRGDWQILRWLFPTIPDASGRKVPQPVALDFALENSRQPASQPRGAVHVPVVARRLDSLARLATTLESVCSRHDCLSGLPPRHHEFADPSARNSLDQPLLERLGRRANQHRPGCVVADLSAASGLSNDRRDRSHDLPQAFFSQEAARVGYCGGRGKKCARRSSRVLLAHVAC